MVRTTRPNQKKQGIANRDTFSRINYMYQAAHLVLTQNPGNTEVIRFYAYSLKSMAKKQVLRLHPDIKRTICKKCYMLLVPGVTTTIRKKGKKQEHMVVKCLECKTPKRFPAQADYKLWAERPQAWFAMFPPDAPVPVSATQSDHSQVASKDSCSHRRCRRFPRCKAQYRKKEGITSSSKSSETTEEKSIPSNEDDQSKNEKSTDRQEYNGNSKSNSQKCIVKQNNYHDELNTETSDIIQDSIQIHTQTMPTSDCTFVDTSQFHVSDCDRNSPTDTVVSNGTKREFADSSPITPNPSLKRRRVSEKKDISR